jgi:hypothetical protein
MPRARSSSSPRRHLCHRQPELGAVTARACQRAAAARRQLHPHADLRADADFFRVFENQPELGVFLDDRNDVRPIFWASIAISMNSASLNPLQMIGVSL